MTISRRSALQAIATLSATGASTAALALPAISQPADALPVLAPSAAPGETAVQRVNRLAAELSHAMDDWMEDLAEPGRYAHWIAYVHPAGLVQNPVFFENSMRPSPDRELVRLGQELDEAWSKEKALLHVNERGVLVAVDEVAWEAANDYSSSIVEQIESLPAKSIDGLRVKAAAIDWCHSGEQHDHDFNEQQTTNVRLAQQIVRTLLKI